MLHYVIFCYIFVPLNNIKPTHKDNKKMKQVNKVKLKPGTRPILAEIFKVSVTSISLAANGHLNSKKGKEIRERAVELGGDPIYSNN